MAYNLESIRLDFKKQGITARIGSKEIKDYIDSTGANREEVVAYFKKKYGENTGINRGQEETTYSARSDSASLSSSSFSSSGYNFSGDYYFYGDVNKPNPDSIKRMAAEKFMNNVINPSLSREGEVTNIFKNTFKAIRSKEDVLVFLNKKSTPSNDPKQVNFNEIQKIRKEISNEYSKVFKEGATKDITGKIIDTVNNFDPKKLVDLKNKLQALFNNIDELMKEAVLDTPQFIGYYLLLKGELYDFVKSLEDPNLGNIIFEGGVGVQQIERSATTAFELLERINLGLYLANEALNNTSVRVVATGSQESDDFIKQLKKDHTIVNKEGKEVFELKDFDQIKSSYLKLLKDRAANGKLTGTLTGLSQISGYWSGSQQSFGTDDLSIEIGSGNNKQRILVDAKLGSYFRYIGSISTFQDKKSITIKDLIASNTFSVDSRDKTDLAGASKEQIETILSLFVLSSLKGVENKKLFVDFRNMLTYSFLGSSVFLAKFKKDGIQADLAIIKDRYIWFSQILKTFYYDYFEQSGGEKAKFNELGSAITQSAGILKKYKESYQTLNFLNELQKNGVLSQDLKSIYDLFYSVSVSLSITRDIKENI